MVVGTGVHVFIPRLLRASTIAALICGVLCTGLAMIHGGMRLSLAVRWGEGALIYVVSTLLGYGIIGATVLLCARAL